MSDKVKKETPAAVAAAGVTTETQSPELITAIARAEAAETKAISIKEDLTAKLLDLNTNFDALVERNITAESKLTTVENENRALLAKVEEAEGKLATAQNQLEYLKDVVAEAAPEKLLYEAENGHTYEFTQAEFRFQGNVHKAAEVSPELAEQLIAVKSFVLNKI